VPKLIGPKVVAIDIETAPLEAYTWGIWEQNVALDQIKTDWSILSFSAKWLHERKIIYADTGGRGPDKVRDDSELLKQLWDVLDAADIVVAQNGKAFDIKKINARLIRAGFPPYSPIRIVDTMLVAKKAFAFTSTKLAFLSANLTKTKKLTHKKFPGFSLWLACLDDNPAAWREMRRYNEADTRATEELYLKLRPWIDGHPNVGVYVDSTAKRCPKCGSTKLLSRGRVYSATASYVKYRCSKCGGFSRGRKAEKRTVGVTN